MGYQRLSQTRKPQAYSQPQGEKRANYSPHPIEELQGGIGNRAMGRMLQAQGMSQGSMVRKPLFRGLSHEWEGKKQPGEIPVQAQLDETGKEGSEERAEVNNQPSMGVRKPLFRGLSYEWEGKKPQREIPVQAKLMVGKADDRFEEEADRVAAAVVQQIDGQTPPPLSQGETVQREEMEEEKLQRKPSVASLSVVEGGMAAPAELERAIQGARGSGQPLAESVREPMERAFGADFSGVRVHRDAQSDALNQSLSSRAFTTGEDIFFRQGEYEPGSLGGQKLLAHELTHVVQQSSGVVQQLPRARTSATPRIIQRGGGIEAEEAEQIGEELGTFLATVYQRLFSRKEEEIADETEDKKIDMLKKLNGRISRVWGWMKANSSKLNKKGKQFLAKFNESKRCKINRDEIKGLLDDNYFINNFLKKSEGVNSLTGKEKEKANQKESDNKQSPTKKPNASSTVEHTKRDVKHREEKEELRAKRNLEIAKKLIQTIEGLKMDGNRGINPSEQILELADKVDIGYFLKMLFHNQKVQWKNEDVRYYIVRTTNGKIDITGHRWAQGKDQDIGKDRNVFNYHVNW